MSFSDLNLHPQILKAIEESGYLTPTPIQEKAIPVILDKCDLRASAQTGTGKSAAFILPVLHQLMTPSSRPGRGPRMLILVPTRELAMQVASQTIKYSKHLKRMKTVCIYGGVPYPIQNRQLSQHHEILVATPGRLIDHLDRGRVNLSRVETLVLDEADRMLDMGFIEPVEKIADATPKDRQTLLFSATLKGSVLKLSKRLMDSPEEIHVDHEHAKHENIEQRLHYVDGLDHKHKILDSLLKDQAFDHGIIFTSTKRFANTLVEKLINDGHSADALHGDMNQRQRTRTIKRLRQGKSRILVATDVAARGIDILTLSYVINFDLPNNAEDYVHRIGRTGRAGGKGIALSFAASKDRHLVREIERYTGQQITPHEIPGLEPKLKQGAKPNRKKPWQKFSKFPRGGKRRPGFSTQGRQKKGFRPKLAAK